MALRKFAPSEDASSAGVKVSSKMNGAAPVTELDISHDMEPDVDIDLREVYFLIMHFLSAGPCQRTFAQFRNELLEHQLLPRRYHAWYSRSGVHSGDENDDDMSFPLSYNMLVQRYSHVEKDHLVKLLRQLILSTAPQQRCMLGGSAPTAADVPTLMGTDSFSLLSYDRDKGSNDVKRPPAHMRWPHMRADQFRGLSLREIGGGFTRHHRAPSIRAACYAIAKPSVMVDRMQNMKKLRGHRNAVYCATLDCSGRYVITGSDDRLVKIWSMETSYCLASCRGHDGDITDLSVSSNNAVVASSSNDCAIRVWRLPDGFPISTLRGHTGAVTAIVFNPRPNSTYHLLSSSDDGTCRIWDARYSNMNPRIYTPKRPDSAAGNVNGPSSSTGAHSHQIFCCAFNANGTVFVTGSSDTLARVWTAAKPSPDDSEQPTHEIDVLSGHENDVNYVQFSGCAIASKYTATDTLKEENIPKFKNTWFTHDNIVTCSRDGSAIIWIPRLRRSHGKAGRWMRAYHLKVPPPPMPPQPPREGPRQRILPTPRGVNMIIWSLDNRFVLAAIMDCRICVWNASDGSLVHSLTGHTESTYVLDVHPFNPRIAMSAGYDGKIIMWDIWEGKPIWIHEISRFKLVDGKFSPDGTSVILSDDVGQLYIINTGQGEYQMDAKYDQFFLGDYRPLAYDSSGGLIDQETQISPYRRNLQDLLCDSGMIPYPEPYQSAYQQRRLGALGIEWRPTNLKFATGPDFSFDPDNQILPLTDLDISIEPLPEFLDIMDWEPENEIQSDDTDSEYNVTEDYSTGGEQGNMSSNSLVDPECSSEDGGIGYEMDGFRRSKRKKQKADIEIMTSSGRRVKRRNLDDSDGNTVRSRKIRKSKNWRKDLKRKSFKSKSFRPQRAAARNALTLFSKITRTSTDMEDDNVSEGEPESESTQPDSIMDSDGSDKYFQNELTKHIKGKEISLDESENRAKPHAFDTNSGNKKSLILKLPRQDSNKHVDRVSTLLRCDNQAELVGPSEVHLEAYEANVNHVGFKDPKCSIEDAKWNVVHGHREVSLDIVHDHLRDGKIKWGMVRARSFKRQKLTKIKPFDTSARTSNLNCCHETENDVVTPGGDSGVQTSGLETKMCVRGIKNVQDMRHSTSDDFGATANSTEHSIFTEFDKDNQSSEPIQVANLEAAASFIHTEDRADLLPDLNENIFSTSTKLRFERISKNPESLGKEELKSSIGNLDSGSCDSLNGNHSKKEQDSFVPEDDTSSEINLDHKADVTLEYGLKHEKKVLSTVEDSGRLHSQENKMYSVVYRRSRSHRGSNNLGVDIDGKGRSTADLSNTVRSAGVDLHEGSSVGACRTRSMVSKVSTHSTNTISDDPKLNKFRSNPNSTSNRRLLLHEECETSSRVTVGLRSNRTRRGSPYVSDTGSVDRRKPHKSSKRRTWLMLTTHEKGYRYIPQLGDEVVYLRQGHHEYLEFSGLKYDPPWASIKGSVRAVEFCKVKILEYSSLPGSGESCCKMTIQFVDPDSDVFGQSFKLTLPEVTNFPDFLVEKTRYDAAIWRNWTKRDKCKVWWNDGEIDGSWWDGRIIHVKPKSLEFPDSPWEMYTIQYKSDPPETHLHSPWELFDGNTQWEHPHIDDESKNKLHSAFAKLEQSGNTAQDRFGVQKLKQLSQKPQYMNRFPVPLSLDVIESRLENNYYRSLRALNHDFIVMLSNAETYLANNSEVLQRLKRLSDWFTKQFPSL